MSGFKRKKWVLKNKNEEENQYYAISNSEIQNTENYSKNMSTIQFNCKGHIGWYIKKTSCNVYSIN